MVDTVDISNEVDAKELGLFAARASSKVVYDTTILGIYADGTVQVEQVSMTLEKRCRLLEKYDQFACGTYLQLERSWNVCSNSDEARRALMRHLKITEQQIYKKSRHNRPIR